MDAALTVPMRVGGGGDDDGGSRWLTGLNLERHPVQFQASQIQGILKVRGSSSSPLAE